MYINSPKKLFNDLYNLPTMRNYMVACKEDGMDEDLSNLISIVECNRGEIHYDDEGSLRWDLAQCETEQERNQTINDSYALEHIWRIIQRELRARYVIVCGNCKTVYFYQRKPKGANDLSRYYCGKCKNEFLSFHTFKEWAVGENIYNDIEKYIRNTSV